MVSEDKLFEAVSQCRAILKPLEHKGASWKILIFSKDLDVELCSVPELTYNQDPKPIIMGLADGDI